VTAFGIASRHAAAHPQAGLPPTRQAPHVLAHGIAAGFTLGTVFCACALVLAIVVIKPLAPTRTAA
jgi:hypothetical protein